MHEKTSLRELYAEYLQGRATFEELTEATDRAIHARERSTASHAEQGESTASRVEKRD